MMTLLGFVEICRMVVVSNALALSARAAVRYAIVHGSSRTGTGVDGPSSPSSYSQVTAAATSFASQSLMDTSRLVITVNYADSANTKGSRVQVSVVYPYNPFATWLSLSVRLGSTAWGVIVF